MSNKRKKNNLNTIHINQLCTSTFQKKKREIGILSLIFLLSTCDMFSLTQEAAAEEKVEIKTRD